MHTNYTPLDFAKVRPDTKPTKVAEKKSKSKAPKDYDLIDKIFFPFALAVLVISLSLYAVKFVIESANTPASANTEAEEIVVDLTGTPVPPTPATTSAPQAVYKKINAIVINTDKITSTAGVRYPNLSERELNENINNTLLQWAALRGFFATKPAVLSQLTVPISEPVATYSAVIRDLGVLTSQYDKQGGNPKPIANIVEDFKKTSTIQ